MKRSEPGISSQTIINRGSVEALSPAWREFIRFCGDLRFGEIERLSIQNGIPVIAELTKKKVKFTSEA